MNTLKGIALWMGAALGAAFGQEQLVTAQGNYATGEGKASVEIKLPDESHLEFKVVFKTQRVEEGTGRIFTNSRSVGSQTAVPVKPNIWAFCLVADDEIWGYLGPGSIYRYKNTPEGLKTAGGCSEPKLEDRAPGALKAWIKSKETNSEPGPTRWDGP